MPGRSDIRPLTLANALLVAHEMRPESHRDVASTAGELAPDVIAMNRLCAPGTAWSFHCPISALPFAVAGLEEERPGVLTWWMISTRKVEKHALTIARFGRNAVSSLLATGECHRIQAFVLADWPQACKLMEVIGLHREGVMRSAGIRQEDIAVFAATHERTFQTEAETGRPGA